MFYNEIFPWYISVTTHVLDFRFATNEELMIATDTAAIVKGN